LDAKPTTKLDFRELDLLPRLLYPLRRSKKIWLHQSRHYRKDLHGMDAKTGKKLLSYGLETFAFLDPSDGYQTV